MSQTDPRTIAAGLTEAQRSIVVALCGNAWNGQGQISPGIAIANGLELMHIDMLKSATGEPLRYKAKPTPLGLAVRAILESDHEPE